MWRVEVTDTQQVLVTQYIYVDIEFNNLNCVQLDILYIIVF